MSGFKKCGIYPFNPSAVEDRQTDPSKAFRSQKPEDKPQPVGEQPSDPGSPLFTSEQEALFKRRFEEGYDLNDPAYMAWLKINHPEVALSITGSDELSLSSEKSIPSSSTTASVGVSSSDVLSEVLTLPPPKPPKTKRKTAVNSKAVCITDEEVLQEMKIKEVKKHEAEQEITTRKLEREKRQERELMKAKKEEQKKQKAREREEKERGRVQKRRKKVATSSRKPKKTVDVLANLSLADDENTDLHNDMPDSDSDDAVCPKCGLTYGDDYDGF